MSKCRTQQRLKKALSNAPKTKHPVAHKYWNELSLKNHGEMPKRASCTLYKYFYYQKKRRSDDARHVVALETASVSGENIS